MGLRWTQRAADDLIEIGRYIVQDDPAAARAWVERLRQRARQAAKMPRAGRVVPERQCQDIREVLLRSYRIVYRVIDKKAIEILAVFEGHRLFPEDVAPEEEQ
ncbi:MAG: type II toxin-antitoxin system RelE/ParE family toxin [Gammaproteobacteria bacterium]|nr:type II toxin-antitoxin system RelE/ParE family toxin [Gammaproteobacteria bacterium]